MQVRSVQLKRMQPEEIGCVPGLCLFRSLVYRKTAKCLDKLCLSGGLPRKKRRREGLFQLGFKEGLLRCNVQARPARRNGL